MLDRLVNEQIFSVWAHMQHLGVGVADLCNEWMLTLFAKDMPHSRFKHWIAMFLKDGWPAFYKVVLTILQALCGSILKSKSKEEVLLVFANSFCTKKDSESSSKW